MPPKATTCSAIVSVFVLRFHWEEVLMGQICSLLSHQWSFHLSCWKEAAGLGKERKGFSLPWHENGAGLMSDPTSCPSPTFSLTP